MSSTVKDTARDKLFLISTYVYVAIALILVAYPLVYILSASISNPKYVGSGEMWLFPKGLTFEGYQIVFANTKIWMGYANTILYTVVGTAVNLLVTIPAAYALSRKDFVGRNFFMGMFMVTMFFGGGLVPTYLLVKGLGLMNSMWRSFCLLRRPSGTSSCRGRFFKPLFRRNCKKRPRSTAARICGCF